jgi:hypothetical protein
MGTFIQTIVPQPQAAASSGQTWRNEMASFFTFDRNISAIAGECKPNDNFGNAFSEIFSERSFDRYLACFPRRPRFQDCLD